MKNVIDLAIEGVLVQRASAEGVEIKSEAELGPLVALRRMFPRQTTTVHGNLKQGLMPGQDGYELEAVAAAPSTDDVAITTKPDVDGA